jgi:UDP-N-acetylmuramoyl-L-alanyl-D-glutamate--2,6-diaminopimelate ligase
MLFSQLLKNVEYEGTFKDFEVTAVNGDSRNEIEKNSVFVCIKGFQLDGHIFAQDVIKRGAGAVVVERDMGVENQIIVKNTRAAYALLCCEFYSNPSHQLKLIGVTGTNGKTTITNVIGEILRQNGHKVGVIGTIENVIDTLHIPAKHTTPDPLELNSLFRRMVDAGCDYAVMEVSSHALDQHRLDGCRFEVGVFTNLTQDHLDYHGSMENYFEAKSKLFDICKKSVINIDDDYGVSLVKKLKEQGKEEVYTFSTTLDQADYTAKSISLNADGVKFAFVGKDIIERISFCMPGVFSVSNAMAALSSCINAGISSEDSANAIALCKGVKGRTEVLYSNADYTIICDYAHTPDGLEKILSAIKSFARGRIVTLFGCAGNRDATKRPKMASAVARGSDFVVLTSDNPRSENAQKIIDDAIVGFKGFNTPYTAIADRYTAIEWAIDHMQKDDILLLAGKGHEDYQVLDFGTICFDEHEIVKDLINKNGIGRAVR